MNVKEMLLNCAIEQAAALHFGLQEPPKCNDWGAFLQVHNDFLREIAALEPIPSEYVILGSTTFSNGNAHHSIHRYSQEELHRNFCRCEIWEEDRPLEAFSKAELEQIDPNVPEYRLPDHYDMELMPWEELLGVEVFEDNLQTFGHDLMAALVIREMSLWGLNRECSAQGQNRFWERLEEALQGVDEMPRYTSVEEAIAALNEPGDEEEEEAPMLDGKPIWDTAVLSEEISPVDWARAGIAQYRELLRYVAHSHSESLPTLMVVAGVDGAGKTSACGVWRECYPNILETALTMADLEKIRQAREGGCYIQLMYLGCKTLEEHLLRNQNRRTKDGEFVEPMMVAKQYAERFEALEQALPLCHEASFFDCTEGFCKVATYYYGQVVITEDGVGCSWLQEWQRNRNK